MSEYIEREAVRNALYDADAITMKGVAILNKFPAADVEPVVHASWVNAEEKPYIRKHFHKKVCSNCFREGQERWKRCPYCEAKMDGEEKR